MNGQAVGGDSVQTATCDEQGVGMALRLHPDDLQQLAIMISNALNAQTSSLLVSEKVARVLCGGVAKSTWDRWDSNGIIPAPVRIEGRVFWERFDIDNWIKWGRPGRTKFEVLKRNHSNSSKKGNKRQ